MLICSLRMATFFSGSRPKFGMWHPYSPRMVMDGKFGNRPHRSRCAAFGANMGFRFFPRDAMLSAVYAVVCVYVSVILLYCIKTAKHRITQITPHDSPMTLVFWSKDHCEFRTGSPPMGATNADGVG